MQPCKYEVAIAALFKEIWIINSCVLTSFFFSSPFQRNCRYDGQIAVFGSKLQELLGKQRYFLVSGPVRSSVSMF